MPIQTGDRLTPGRLNTQVDKVALGAAYTLTGTLADLPGVSLTFVTPYPNARWFASWSGDFELTVAGAGAGLVSLAVDGIAIATPQAVWNPSNVAANARVSASQSTSGTWTAAGTHTIKLQAQRTGGGTARLNAGHTQLTVIVIS